MPRTLGVLVQTAVNIDAVANISEVRAFASAWITEDSAEMTVD